VDECFSDEKNAMVRVETERLVLVPVGPEHADDLYQLHRDPWVATWYAGRGRAEMRRRLPPPAPGRG
jgi:hypothetical protein